MRIKASQIRLLAHLFGSGDSLENSEASKKLAAIFPDAFKWERLQAEIVFRRHDFAGGDMVIDILVSNGLTSPATTLLTVWRPGKDKDIEIAIDGYVYKVVGDAFQGTIKVFRCAE